MISACWWLAGWTLAASAADTTQLPVTIGLRDRSDTELDARSALLDFFPGQQPAKDFAKLLDRRSRPAQYLHLTLDPQTADDGLTVDLAPAWHDGNAPLRVALEIWRDGSWLRAGDALVHRDSAGAIDVDPAFLQRGTVDLRLRLLDEPGDSQALTWDQVVIDRAPFTTLWSAGANDASEHDLAVEKLPRRAHLDAGQRLGKEVNTTWWPVQELAFTLDGRQSQRAALLSLDPLWSDGGGTLRVAVERAVGDSWDRVATVAVGARQPATVVVPAYRLTRGLNLWRLVALDGNRGTSAVVWDRVALRQRRAPARAHVDVVGDLLDTTLGYFVASPAMTTSGLAATAFKVGDRARFGYSNPTEWGLTMQAWAIAAERGLLPVGVAGARIAATLATMQRLQADAQQFHAGLFFPYYTVIDPSGADLRHPKRTADLELPAGDCALLWASLVVVEGWLLTRGMPDIAARAAAVRGRISVRAALMPRAEQLYLSMLVNAETGAQSPYTWLFWADEGGVVAMVAALSRSVSTLEYQRLLATQWRPRRVWRGHVTEESAYYNAMFTWGQRSILGFPVLDGPASRYGTASFLPTITAHLDHARELGVAFAGFSDAMTQRHGGRALVGRYVPPNIENRITAEPPRHLTPHALAVPFCLADALDEATLRALVEQLVRLRADPSGVWHPRHSRDPYGFEVVASATAGEADYPGADDGRYIFETLAQAYTALSLYEGLARWLGWPTHAAFAARVPGHADAVRSLLLHAYPERRR